MPLELHVPTSQLIPLVAHLLKQTNKSLKSFAARIKKAGKPDQPILIHVKKDGTFSSTQYDVILACSMAKLKFVPVRIEMEYTYKQDTIVVL